MGHIAMDHLTLVRTVIDSQRGRRGITDLILRQPNDWGFVFDVYISDRIH